MRPGINLLFALAIVSIASASIEAAPQVIVRVYTQAAAPPEGVEPALATAGAILGAAGVEIVWRRCDIGAAAAASCATPLRGNELAVRLLLPPASAGSDEFVQLGYSMVDTGVHAGALASIYPARVTMLAREAGIDASLLLGRAIAHEIGHLLLGTSTHAAEGLMRAVWSIDTLHRDVPVDWLFTPRDAAAMQTALR